MRIKGNQFEITTLAGDMKSSKKIKTKKVSFNIDFLREKKFNGLFI